MGTAIGMYACVLCNPNNFVSGVVSWALGAIAFETSGRGGSEFDRISSQFPDMVIKSISTASAILSIGFATVTVAQTVVKVIKTIRASNEQPDTKKNAGVALLVQEA